MAAALKHPIGVKLSNVRIAEHCGVDDQSVASVRSELEAPVEIPTPTVRTGRDGRTINATNIRPKPEPVGAPSAAVTPNSVWG